MIDYRFYRLPTPGKSKFSLGATARGGRGGEGGRCDAGLRDEEHLTKNSKEIFRKSSS